MYFARFANYVEFCSVAPAVFIQGTGVKLDSVAAFSLTIFVWLRIQAD